MKKDLITAGFSAAEIIALGFTQFGCRPAPVAPINNENNTITTENNPQQSNEVLKITSADLTLFKAENQKKDIISSLPSDRPKNKNDNFDVFKVKIGEENIKFVMYEIEDEEVLNGVAITTQSNGQETISIQNIALFTEVIEFGGTKRWERLIATNPSLNGENTVWIYDPNGYPTEARPINTDRAVFGYNHNGTNVLVQPIIIDPNQIEGYDNTQALPVVLVDTPSLMKNASPIKLEAPAESQLPEEMTEEYLNDFKTTEKGIKQINGKDTNVIYGVKEDGTKLVIAMEIETDRELKMTRVGEYTDDAGFSYYVMMDKTPKIDGSMGGRFNVTDDTAKKLFKIDTEKGAVNIWKSLGRQWGISPEEARDRVMIDNKGLAKFNVAVGVPGSPLGYPSKSQQIPNDVNFNLPVAIITIGTNKDYQSLPDNIKEKLIVDLNLYRDSSGTIDTEGKLLGDGIILGSLLTANEKGQLTIIAVSTGFESTGALTPDKLSKYEQGYVDSYLIENIGPAILMTVDMVSQPNESVSKGVPFTTLYKPQFKSLLETNGFVNSSSQ